MVGPVRDHVQELLHGLAGQSLTLIAPEGRPSSVTSVVVVEATNDDDGQAVACTTGSASISSVNTTLAAAAGPSQSDPTLIELTSATGIEPGEPYLLVDADGETEEVILGRLDGTDGYTRVPLLNDYPSGAAFQSAMMSIGIDSTWVAEKNNLTDGAATSARYRAIWTYVVNSVTHRRATSFDLVRYTSSHNVTPLDVDAAFPGFLDRLPVDYRRDQGRPLIERAFRAVRMDLRADGKLARWMRDMDVVEELVMCRANLCGLELAALHGGASADQLVVARDVYKQRYDQLVREPHTPLAASSGGAEVPARREPLLRR